ncbi:serine protein kinase RIO [Shewanella sp. Choline-02u-19]|uniref:PA4780 family RIO1-like protein kinase n=1 Tax=Shewanella TaxID=22 RepID=UPI000C33D52B|nr:MULTISPECIES: PA4780 family RIO1-like protein kinase [Shewanella]MCL1058507.1 serine protein kinase RIO [Shewanella gelidimarina]PKG57874.1 serine protein kinase RIO [Shewanella sp. GutDb-MelDb]PKG76037.1 serine protein kinase RIO [Shewanella sp. GutCb]PKH56682.1 serine protein kinase RIO [Shewanella sp. Bg11-22]PKI30233.1 serine protein kinase RIO [Shewanella sp. Choline-02u-19]
MKTPKRLQPLVDEGLIDEVVRPLMSGKEADVYIVRCGDDVRCAKIYKEADKRSFKKAVEYREGRKGRNSRRTRAMEKGSNYGRQEQENAWQNAEVDALYRLADAGVRVPQPYGCFDGVLLMELVTDDAGFVAPRLNDISLTEEMAIAHHYQVMKDVQRMLCAGLIHGDLSEFNVLLDDKGPVIIDLPQAVDAAANNNAKRMLLRDVNNMTQYYGQFAPSVLKTKYAQEMWLKFESGDLSADSELTGEFIESEHTADINAVLEEIQAAFEEEQERKERISDAAEQDEY